MPRKGRVVVPGVPHHVVQRGNNQQDVFFADADRRAYLGFLREQAKRCGVDVLGYCLMRNHVHLVVTPHEAVSLARGVGRTHWRYTQYVNALRGKSGHLWQSRFYSCPLDEAHTVAALRYVEQNPVRVGAVTQAWRYEWSSAPAHVGQADHVGLLDIEGWRAWWSPAEWMEYLLVPEEDTVAARLRVSTARGLPVGTSDFLRKVEQIVG